MSSNRITKRIRNSAVIKSPLLFEAIGLCPVVAIALSLKQALFLAVVTTIGTVITLLTSSVLPMIYEKSGLTKENAAVVTSNPDVLNRVLRPVERLPLR